MVEHLHTSAVDSLCSAVFCAGMRVKLLQTVLAAAILMTLKEEIFLAVRSVLAPKPRKLY